MLPQQPCFVFYIESLLNQTNTLDPYALSFINKLPKNNCYFFTHNCDISRQTFYNDLVSKNIPCVFDNVITPNYIISNYYRNTLGNLSVYTLSSTKDFHDFDNLNIRISSQDPDLIFIQTLDLSEEDMNILYKNKSSIIISSNLCTNRTLTCSSCTYNCLIKNLKEKFKFKIIIPDMPSSYNTLNLFKFMNISPKRAVVVTNILRDDYFQYQRLGGKLILILNNGTTYNDYLKSHYDPDLVLDNFHSLSTFLNRK